MDAGSNGVIAPSHDDPIVAYGSEVIGGPLGRRAMASRRWWTPLRVLIALTFLTSGVGLVQKDWCRQHAWGVPGVYSHACYSDIPALYYGRGLADGEVPYITQVGDRQVEYPVLTGAVMWVTAKMVPSNADPTEQVRWYFDINALVIAIAAALAVGATARLAGRRPWDAAMFALAPVLALTGTINWDMYAVALLALGMLAWARERPASAGLLIGLATAAKFYPLFVLGPLLVLCLRAGRLRAFGTALFWAVVAWLAVNVPIMVADFDGWSKFYRLSQSRGDGFSSIWFLLSQQGHGVAHSTLNTLAGGLFGLICVAIAVLTLAAPRRPRLPQVTLLVVAAFLLTNKVYSPQYVLWLVPLAVLARPRWRDFLIWQLGEVIHFVGIWYLILGYPPGNPDRALDSDSYGVTVLAHIVATLWLCGVVVRDMLRPQHDPVRFPVGASASPYGVGVGGASVGGAGVDGAGVDGAGVDGAGVGGAGVDDPAGGVLDGAPDVFHLVPRQPTPATSAT